MRKASHTHVCVLPNSTGIYRETDVLAWCDSEAAAARACNYLRSLLICLVGTARACQVIPIAEID